MQRQRGVLHGLGAKLLPTLAKAVGFLPATQAGQLGAQRGVAAIVCQPAELSAASRMRPEFLGRPREQPARLRTRLDNPWRLW